MPIQACADVVIFKQTVNTGMLAKLTIKIVCV